MSSRKFFRTGFRAPHGILVAQVQQILQLTLLQVVVPVCSMGQKSPFWSLSNFLEELYHDCYSYSSLNSYRFAISSIHEHIEDHPVGQHPQVTHILKGAYNLRPPTPRYSNT